MTTIVRSNFDEKLELFEVALDDGFNIRIILPTGAQDITDEYVTSLAEQRRSTRLSFTATENTKRGYLTGMGDG